MEAEDVFVGLAERFGDEAPRVMYAGTENDAIVIPAKGPRGIRKRMGWAGMRLREGVPIERRPGHKPEVDDLTDPEARASLAKGYDGLRAGITDGARRPEDQDIDGESNCSSRQPNPPIKFLTSPASDIHNNKFRL